MAAVLDGVKVVEVAGWTFVPVSSIRCTGTSNRGAVLDGLLGSSAEPTFELGSLIRATVTSGGEIPLLVEV